MNLLTRVMAAEEDHVEAALLDRLRLYNAARKQHGLPLMGQPDFRDEAQAQLLLDRLFLPCLPYGQLVADTKWSTGRLFGWFFLEESSNGGLAFLDFDGPLPPETQECETFFTAAATARDKESLFVVLAPLVFSRFVADDEPQGMLFMFRGRSLWHRLGQACNRHTHWPSARTELVLITLLRFIRVLYEWQGGGSSNIPETTVEQLASAVLRSSNQQILLAGLELIRALVTCGNDSSASELYPEGGKLGQLLLSLSDRGGAAPSEVRALATDCLHPAKISPDSELRGEYLNRLWDVCRNRAHEQKAGWVSALKQLAVFYRRNEGEPFASDHLEVILSILTDEDKAVQLSATYLLNSYLSQSGVQITANGLMPRIISVLIGNTLLSKPGVPSLVGLCLDHWVEHSAALEGFLARLPADLSGKLASHRKDAQREDVAGREESEAVREVSAMCLERMAADQPEQVVAEVWQLVGPTLRPDSPWQIRERAFTLLGVLAQIAPGLSDHLAEPHMDLLIQSLADPVAEVRATSAWTLVHHVRLVADSRLTAVVEALLAMARRDDAKSCQAATSALVDLLTMTPPLLDEESQATIVSGAFAIWDNPPSPKASQSVLDVFLAWVRNGAASEQSRAELVPALMGRLLAQPIPLKLQTGIFHIFASLAEQGNIPASLVAEVVNACVSPVGDHDQQGDDDDGGEELPKHRLRWALRVLSALSRDPRGHDLSGLVASPDRFVDALIKPGLRILTVETLDDCFTLIDHVIEHWPQALATRHSQLTPSLFNFVLRLPHPRTTLFPLLVRMGLAYTTSESRPQMPNYISATLDALPLSVLLAWAHALFDDSPGELLRGLTRQPESSADDTPDTRETQHAARLVQEHAQVIVELLTTPGDLPDTFGPRERAAMLRLFCHHHHHHHLATDQRPTSDLATRALELLIAGDGEAVAAELRSTLLAAELGALVLTTQQLMPADHTFSRLLAL